MGRGIITVLAFAVLAATGDGPVVIVTSDQPVFRAAAEGARASAPGAVIVSTSGLAPDTLASASTVVGVGPLALRAIADAKVGAPVVACLSPTVRGLPAGSHVLPLYPSTDEAAEVLRAVFPAAKRVAVFRSTSYPLDAAALERQAFAVVAPPPGVALTTAIERVLAESDVVWITDPGAFGREVVALEFLLKSAVAKGVPVVGANKAMVDGGAVLALVPDPALVGSAAGVVARALSTGAAPPRLPPVSQLLVSDRVAARLRISIPPALATRVVRQS